MEEIFNKESTYWDATQEGSAIDVLAEAIASTYDAFSDVAFEIVSLEPAGENQFFLEWQMTGTNTGSFFGYPPTGKKIEIQGLDALKIASDKIAEIKSFYDSKFICTTISAAIIV